MAYDPIVVALCWAVPHDSGWLGRFADDIGNVFRNTFGPKMSMTPVFRDMAGAPGIRVNGRKRELLYYVGSPWSAVRDEFLSCDLFVEVDIDRLTRPVPRGGPRAGVSRFPVGGGALEVQGSHQCLYIVVAGSSGIGRTPGV